MKKNFELLLAVVLCLSLTAYGVSNDDLDTPVVGNDWRVTGVVRDSGVVVGRGFFTREDVGELYILVTVDENSASFYLDEPEQYLVGCVMFPVTIPTRGRIITGSPLTTKTVMERVMCPLAFTPLKAKAPC